jgi:hypothetical protein
VGTDNDWATAIAGRQHSFAIKTDGTLYGWGDNSTGEVGVGTDEDINAPVLIGSGWAIIAAGDDNSLGIKTDGTLYGWGLNNYGEAGIGNTDSQSTPVQVGTNTNWTAITAGDDKFSLGLQADGNLWAWGRNNDGVLGDGTEQDQHEPVRIGELVLEYTATQTVSVLLSPNSISMDNVSAADCQNTTCTSDDTFTADVTVLYQNKPASGTLTITGPTIVGTVASVNVADIGATEYTFTGVTMVANGEDVELSASFSEGCNYTDDEADTAPSCSGSTCAISNITLANTTACNDNGSTTGADDYFTADVTVTFAYAPAGQTLVLTDESGAVLATKDVNNDLLCTTSWTFVGVELSANGQAVELTASFEFSSPIKPAAGDDIAFAPPPGCFLTKNNLMTAPASCSSCIPTPEICNGLDDDCDGTPDDNINITYYGDADNDGFGANSNTQVAGCIPPAGFVAVGGDCNDNNLAVNPGVLIDICNGIDDNCDGVSELNGCVVPTLPNNNVTVNGTTATMLFPKPGCYKSMRLQYRRTTPANAQWTLVLLPATATSRTVTGLAAGTYQWGLRGQCYSNNAWSLLTYGKNFTIGAPAPLVQNTGVLPTAISVYPNPARHMLNVVWQSETEGSALVRLVDQLGRVVATKVNDTGVQQSSFDVSELVSGFYTVHVLTAGQVQTEKVFVTH